jgi:hypothetical protein
MRTKAPLVSRLIAGVILTIRPLLFQTGTPASKLAQFIGSTKTAPQMIRIAVVAAPNHSQGADNQGHRPGYLQSVVDATQLELMIMSARTARIRISFKATQTSMLVCERAQADGFLNSAEATRVTVLGIHGLGLV